MSNNLGNVVSSNLFQDWEVNKGQFKSRLILVLFRLAYLIRNNPYLFVFFIWYLALYRLIVVWILNVEISWHVKVGRNFKLGHGHSTVVEASTEFGNNCTLRHLTTIGHKILPDGTYSRAPKIGNNVDIGSGVTIIGNIVIGNNVIIGAGAVITKSVPDNCVMVGNPGRLLKMSYTQNTIV
ncbi:MAG: serine acetyltransferase [Pedobacter sp.]|nr:MAG: serine acetyltransferase [Pedobacter sp.]